MSQGRRRKLYLLNINNSEHFRQFTNIVYLRKWYSAGSICPMSGGHHNE